MSLNYIILFYWLLSVDREMRNLWNTKSALFPKMKQCLSQVFDVKRSLRSIYYQCILHSYQHKSFTNTIFLDILIISNEKNDCFLPYTFFSYLVNVNLSILYYLYYYNIISSFRNLLFWLCKIGDCYVFGIIFLWIISISNFYLSERCIPRIS